MMYECYEDVPWCRRSSPVGAITLFWIFFSPAILFTRIVVGAIIN